MIERRDGPPRSRSSAHAGRSLALAALLCSGTVFADPATAEALFRDGRRLLDEGRYDEACVKLAESQAQDPASGTLINLALCYEKQGKLATAWAHYRSAAVLARKDGRADRVTTAERKTAELEGRVPHLILRVAHPRPGMEARWSDVRIGAGAFDTPIPLDPGTYVVTVSAPGFKDFSETLSIAETESRTLVVPDLEASDAGSVAPAIPPPIAPPPPQAAPARATDEENDSRLLGFVVGGVGLVGLGLGTYFGLSSLDAYSEAERACPTHHGCDGSVRSTRDEATTQAWISNVSLAVGIVATGAGAWLLFGSADKPSESVSVRVSPTAGGAEVRVRAPL